MAQAPRKTAPRGGIDLGGTKIQTVVVNSSNQVLGEARRPTPTEGGPEDVAREMAACLREAAEQGGVDPAKLTGVGVGSPGDADEKTGIVSNAKNLPGWDGSFDLAEALSKDLGAPVKLGNDVQVAVDGEFQLGAGPGRQDRARRLVGHRRRRRPDPRRQALARPRGGRRDRPHGRQGGRRAVPVRAPRLHGGLRGPRRDGGARRRKEHEGGAKTKLFEIMEERGRDRLTSGVWERALKKGDELAEQL